MNDDAPGILSISVLTPTQIQEVVLADLGPVRSITLHETGASNVHRWEATDKAGKPVGGLVTLRMTTDGSCITIQPVVYVSTFEGDEKG